MSDENMSDENMSDENMSDGRVRVVDDIADDNKRLEGLASKLCGKTLVIDPEESSGTDLKMMDSTIGAILVKKNGGAGAVSGGPYKNVVTGPGEQSGYVMVIIKPGENCVLYGQPSIRYLRHSS